MGKNAIVFTEVKLLYKNSTTSMGKWMWQNHVQWVAEKANILAEKYKADASKVYCAALLHDIADSQFERGYKDFFKWSEEKGKEILFKAGFSVTDASEIIEVIIRPHSCHKGDLPTTLEGKILSTADSMFHLQTSFFPVLCYMNRPVDAKTYEQWQEWFNEKVEREFGIKIFFEEERNETRKDYEALSRIFKNKTLNNDPDIVIS